MEFIGGALVTIFYIIFLVIGSTRSAIRKRRKFKDLPIQTGEWLHLVIMPIYGYVLVIIFPDELVAFDHLTTSIVFQGLSILAYFVSRNLWQQSGPLVRALIPAALFTGIVWICFQIVHFSFVGLVGGIFSMTFFFTLPYYSLFGALALLIRELLLSLKENRQFFTNNHDKNGITKWIWKLYYGPNGILFQILSFPVYVTVVQLILLLLMQEPDSTIKAFSDSHSGIFSDDMGGGELGNNSATEYVCTVASYGSPWLVKPLHMGHRLDGQIRVNRQLQVCNAFEEMLADRMPKTQHFLRRCYDGLQIPVQKWKSVKYVSNTLFILIKPLEWTCLLALYLFEFEPETKIQKQYLLKAELKG